MQINCQWLRRLFGCKYDLWDAFRAFAINYPGKVKFVTIGNGIVFHSEEIDSSGKLIFYESFPKSGGYNEIVYNGIWLDKESDLICADCTIPHDHKGAVWTPPFPRAPRYYKPTSLTIQTPVIRIKDEQLDLNCKIVSTTYYDAFGTVHPPEMVDVGGNIGKRWTITLAVFGGAERFVLDLGPKEGKFDPTFGVVGHHAGNDWNNMRWLGKVEVKSFDHYSRYTGKI